MIGYVYVIRSHQTDDVYYGSTTQMLCKRMASHRACYKCWLNETKNYVSSYDILKYDDAYIELVEQVNFENKQELTAREGHHIRTNKCVNKRIEGRTQKEWFLENKEHVAEYIKQYKEDHKQQAKDYREENKEKLNEYAKQWREDNKEHRKQYYQQNKEAIKEYKRNYRDSKKNTLAK